jgi:hypothetical protein
MTWKLKKTKQCEKCPWRKQVNPYDIPDGYDIDKHKALAKTIATDTEIRDTLVAMECHETSEAHCIGWLHNQLGEGNNLTLRLKMLSCSNRDYEIIGEQHINFEDTIPKVGE